jgi:hypothetical protein
MAYSMMDCQHRQLSVLCLAAVCAAVFACCTAAGQDMCAVMHVVAVPSTLCSVFTKQTLGA